jgi:hypothetical protein
MVGVVINMPKLEIVSMRRVFRLAGRDVSVFNTSILKFCVKDTKLEEAVTYDLADGL